MRSQDKTSDILRESRRHRVLLVEDEPDVRDLMLLHLDREGLDAVGVERGEEALSVLKRESFDLAIVDWMLPGISGLELCKKIQTDRLARGILMVTARAEAADIVRGLEAGADDYVTKPFEVSVFLARVRALLRRAAHQPKDSAPLVEMLESNGLRLDLKAHRVFCNEHEVHLTPSEFKLLEALMVNAGRVLSREKLIDLVQGEGVVVVDRAVDTHVFGLRKKLGPCGQVIETVRGVGYRVSPLTG